MESQRAKRAIKPPKKYSEDDGKLSPVKGASSIHTDVLPGLTYCANAEKQSAKDSPQAEQPIFVYRLLKQKEVNKDLVHQEVALSLT